MNVASTTRTAVVRAGIPQTNAALYHRIRFVVGDPTAIVDLPGENGEGKSVLILRDIEMQRAKQFARTDEVACPADYSPDSGLSGDRETATAQSVAECLRRANITQVIADRTLPLIYADQIQQAGIAVTCDPELGILERRQKDEQEIQWLRDVQGVTEEAMELACRLVAKSVAAADGVLHHEGQPLTSERVRGVVETWLLERGHTTPFTIVAGGPTGADCHNYGSGQLRTEEPVIIDIFPCSRQSLYNGDCTRTVVHGKISAQLSRMLEAVVLAKRKAIEATRSGVTGEAVHDATCASIRSSGFEMGLPDENAPLEYCAMTHGTGHGVGLDVHEPPLLDKKGPPLVEGDALTIEPGLYSRAVGGVRVEDMVIVTKAGCENLNRLQEGLDWG